MCIYLVFTVFSSCCWLFKWTHKSSAWGLHALQVIQLFGKKSFLSKGVSTSRNWHLRWLCDGRAFNRGSVAMQVDWQGQRFTNFELGKEVVVHVIVACIQPEAGHFLWSWQQMVGVRSVNVWMLLQLLVVLPGLDDGLCFLEVVDLSSCSFVALSFARASAVWLASMLLWEGFHCKTTVWFLWREVRLSIPAYAMQALLVNFFVSGQVPWTCMGRNNVLLPTVSLPVMGEIVGVNMASLGGYLHSSKARARWAEGFHVELNNHVFNKERDGLHQVLSCLWLTTWW